MLESFTHAMFAELVGEPFRVHVSEADAVNVTLIEADKLRAYSRGNLPAREPFSLVFRGPSQRVLPQGTYPFTHTKLGTFELFVVPIQPDRDGPRYEAIFN